jgi:Replication initiation factor
LEVIYDNLTLPILEAGVDWITCTAPRDDGALDLASYAEALCEQQERDGDKMELYGYQGYRGFQCGPVRWGWGQHGTMAVFTGSLANAGASRIASLSRHWSRLDYQVTVQDKENRLDPSEDYWSATGPADMGATNSVPLTRIQSRQSGNSCYLGSRASGKYLRCYDKAKESKGNYPAGSWRWELELKREHSEFQHGRWEVAYVPLSAQLALIKETLAAYGLGAPFDTNDQAEWPERFNRVRDADRILKWFEVQVAPSVQWVAQARGRDVVRRALNI